jgi:hypothetical protein
MKNLDKKFIHEFAKKVKADDGHLFKISLALSVFANYVGNKKAWHEIEIARSTIVWDEVRGYKGFSMIGTQKLLNAMTELFAQAEREYSNYDELVQSLNN